MAASVLTSVKYGNSSTYSLSYAKIKSLFCFNVAKKTHTLTVLVENKAGVLNRIASLFRQRQYNIESLTVGHSEQAGLSRMTIVIDGQTNTDQVIRQMYKIMEVIKVKELPADSAIIRDLALIQIGVTASDKTKIMSILKRFGVRVIKRKPTHWTVECVGTPDEIDKFLTLLKPFKIQTVSRTGATAIPHSS